jgi:hypothetical protein
MKGEEWRSEGRERRVKSGGMKGEGRQSEGWEWKMREGWRNEL